MFSRMHMMHVVTVRRLHLNHMSGIQISEFQLLLMQNRPEAKVESILDRNRRAILYRECVPHISVSASRRNRYQNYLTILLSSLLLPEAIVGEVARAFDIHNHPGHILEPYEVSAYTYLLLMMNSQDNEINYLNSTESLQKWPALVYQKACLPQIDC